MKQSKTRVFTGSFLTVALLATTMFVKADAKTIWLEEDDFRREIAQGDAETAPVNFNLTVEERTLTAAELQNAARNIQQETVDETQMPSLTAEGGFLLPTYVLPDAAARAQAPAPVAATSGNAGANPWRAETRVATVQAATPAAQPVVLQGIKQTAPVAFAPSAPADNEKALLASIERQYQDTSVLLSQTAKRLEALEAGVNDIKQATVQGSAAQQAAAPRQPLLLPLAPKRDIQPQPVEATSQPVKVVAEKPQYIDYVLQVLARSEAKPVSFSESDGLVLKSIPKEMKLNFLSGSVDVSAQSLKWIKAFSYNAKSAMNKAVEIRMSGQDLDLQSRRFALIKGALLSNGLSERQIRFVLTDRDPDTIVMRTINMPEDQEIIYRQQKGGAIPQIIHKW